MRVVNVGMLVFVVIGTITLGMRTHVVNSDEMRHDDFSHAFANETLSDSEVAALQQLDPFIPSSEALHIPVTIYGGEAKPFGGAQCPFASWTPTIPKSFPLWEQRLINAYTRAWKAKGSPVGIQENDHDYRTLLGQGNTLGFLHARLELSSSVDETRYGLFAETGTIPAVVRFSDFGSSDSPVRLARMAVKVPLATAWGGEVNLLMTETLDSFPVQDYQEWSSFVTDTALPWYQMFWEHLSLKTLLDDAKLSISSAWVLGVRNFAEGMLSKIFGQEVLAKSYYGQTPYMLGDHQAMKFSFIASQRTCGETDDASTQCCLPKAARFANFQDPKGYVAARAGATAAFLARCDAKFDLMLQVKKFSSNEDTILHDAASSWRETPIKVGTLTIPRQNVAADKAVSYDLQQKLAETLQMEPEGVDKIFAFHPIATHEDNRPVGDINDFRSAFYSQNTRSRFHTIHDGVFLRSGSNVSFKTVQQMPFTKLSAAGVFGSTAS